MIRGLIYILAAIFIISVVRMIVGVVMRGFTDMVNAEVRSTPGRPSAPISGELKKDPVCGTFVPAGSSIQKNVKGEVVYFCSAECRDRYAG